MSRALRCGAVIVLCLLSACESTPTHLLTYAAAGTEIQADRWVGKLLGKDVWPLPYQHSYESESIAQPLLRMQARFPMLRSWLESEDIGFTEDGDIAIRSAENTSAALIQLVREENLDRHAFYLGMCNAVGHGGDARRLWLPYVRKTFGDEWQKQAPEGWWWRDEAGYWQKK